MLARRPAIPPLRLSFLWMKPELDESYLAVVVGGRAQPRSRARDTTREPTRPPPHADRRTTSPRRPPRGPTLRELRGRRVGWGHRPAGRGGGGGGKEGGGASRRRATEGRVNRVSSHRSGTDLTSVASVSSSTAARRFLAKMTSTVEPLVVCQSGREDARRAPTVGRARRGASASAARSRAMRQRSVRRERESAPPRAARRAPAVSS